MVRVGIIGVGNMGSDHARNIVGGKIPNMELTAICDINPKKKEWMEQTLGAGIAFFNNSDEFFANKNLFDAIIIATPHYPHPELAMRGLNEGLHVMCEKPIGVYTKNVVQLNETAKKTDKVFGVMYNQRTNPVYQKLRQLIKDGELGELKRMVWIITSWYRPQSYHDSSQWRSTWEGEGGGVLLNQDPHQLDLWQWIFGMPKRIRGFCYYGKYYNIEVEDDVTAYAEYSNGMTASFITTTGETPGTNRLEASGTMGKIVLENDTITFFRNVVSEREFNRTYTKGFGTPEVWKCDIPVADKGGKQHIGILKNFVEAIETGAELLAPGVEGINGLTISNAIHLSSWLDNWVELPINQDLFYQMLQDKIKNSTFKKEVKENKTLSVAGTH